MMSILLDMKAKMVTNENIDNVVSSALSKQLPSALQEAIKPLQKKVALLEERVATLEGKSGAAGGPSTDVDIEIEKLRKEQVDKRIIIGSEKHQLMLRSA